MMKIVAVVAASAMMLAAPPPATPDIQVIAPKVVYAAALYDNIQRLKLDVRTIVPFHGNRTVDMNELARQSGRAAGR